MNPSISIHEATSDDVSAILSVRHATWIATYPNPKFGIITADIEEKISQKDMGATNEWKKRILEDKQSKTWVAKTENLIVGFIGALKLDDRSQITGMYILPSYHRKGIGTSLMKAALDWLGNEKEIFLEVVAYNTQAIGFYAAFGFVKSRVISNECGQLSNGKQMPEIEMVRKTGI